MLRRALASTRQVLSRPQVLTPICLVFLVVNLLATWARLNAKGSALIAFAALLLSVVRTWAALGVQNVALGLARGETDSDAGFRAWVSPGVLLQTALVGLVVFVGLLVLVLVGVTAIKIGPIGYLIVAALAVLATYAGLAISQYPLLLLEERADMTESVTMSAELTKGHRGTILATQLIPTVLLVAAFGALQLGGAPISGDVPLAFLIGFAPIATVVFAFWAALNASIFLELVADHERRLAEISDAVPTS